MLKIFLSLALFIFACNKSEPIDNNLINAYTELRIAQAEFGDADDGKAARLKILQKYGYSVDSLELDMEKIKKEPEQWLEFQKRVNSILDSLTLPTSDSTAQ